jgi:sugar lactone lactonase YvrE
MSSSDFRFSMDVTGASDVIRIIGLRAALVLPLLMLAGCSDDAATPTPAVLDGLWTASGAPPTVLRLAPGQLAGSGDILPSTAVFTSSAELIAPVGMAFDTSGALWVASNSDSVLVAFAPEDLESSGSTEVSRVIRSTGGSLSGPSGLAFDRAHRLWVANSDNGTLVRLDAAQLSASGAPTPAIIVSGLGHPTALAFGADGSLWVADNQTHTIIEYVAGQLAGSGSPAPTVVLSGRNSSLMNPAGLAFDRSGNLWVANPGNHEVVSFTAAQLTATGSPSPHVVLSSIAGSLGSPVGLAFDRGGSLWVMSVTGILEKFGTAALAVTGAPSPSVRLALTDYTLFSGLAFSPPPAGLPLR